VDATTPRGSPNAMATTRLVLASQNEAGSRRSKSSLTGRWLRSDRPRSPWAVPCICFTWITLLPLDDPRECFPVEVEEVAGL
jgi:hypothetical protein